MIDKTTLTETMMVDGEPTEIDPLSYEVGYTHGQSERPKGEWIFKPKDAIDLMFTKPKCPKCGFESADGGNFCPNCGKPMKRDYRKCEKCKHWESDTGHCYEIADSDTHLCHFEPI